MPFLGFYYKQKPEEKVQLLSSGKKAIIMAVTSWALEGTRVLASRTGQKQNGNASQ